MIVVIYIIFIAINFGMAYLHDLFRRDEIRKQTFKPLRHGLWGLGYAAACFACYPNYYLIAATLLLHLSVFPVFFNTFAEESTFHLSKTSRAITDRIMVACGLKDTALVNISAQIISIVLLILALLNS